MSTWKAACKWIVIISLLFLAIPIRVKRPRDAEHTEALFRDWKRRHNKSYTEGSPEYEKRLQVFSDSLSHVDMLNYGRQHNQTALYGVTQFSDITLDEFIMQYLDTVKRIMKQKDKKRKWQNLLLEAPEEPDVPFTEILKTTNYFNGSIPHKVDWREKGIITSVANQGLCGACWAYSTIQVAEAMAAKKYGVLTELSVQEVIDCAANGNFGCRGGDIGALLSWLKTNNVTIETNNDYPVTGSSGVCSYQKDKKGVAIKNFKYLSYLNKEENILKIIANVGPVAVAINALPWQYYMGGVLQHNCPGDSLSLNHAVQLIGYDLDAPVPYYIAKNSWGKAFGIDGYLHLAIGSNICGLSLEVSSLDVV